MRVGSREHLSLLAKQMASRLGGSPSKCKVITLMIILMAIILIKYKNDNTIFVTIIETLGIIEIIVAKVM